MTYYVYIYFFNKLNGKHLRHPGDSLLEIHAGILKNEKRKIFP